MPGTPAKANNAAILQSFLEAGKSAYLSGEALAAKHRVSRVAIHARIKKLEQSGLRFEAVPRKGYRLSEEPSSLHPDLLEAYVRHSRTPIVPAVLLDETDSTNSEADRRLSAGCPAPIAIFARHQTKGRGRLGREWHSEDPGNLYMSVGFRPSAPGTAISRFSLWAGVHLARALGEGSGLPVMVKWPNDLHVEGKKIGGILCEAKLELDCVQTLVFGFGFNVNQDARTLPSGLRTPATSLSTLLGKAVPLHPLAISVIQAVLAAYSDCQDPASGTNLLQAFAATDALFGKPVQALNGSSTTRGIANGIDDQGNLLLLTQGNQIVPIPAGDVSLVPETSQAQ
jgi:BirA family biotin operon repressor/biotin-[acetyl-CoA-carboxylase] ligase